MDAQDDTRGLTLDSPEAARLARTLAERTGEPLAEAVERALRERLEKTGHGDRTGLADRLLEIGRECAALPVLDDRPADEILGYDEWGLPHEPTTLLTSS